MRLHFLQRALRCGFWLGSVVAGCRARSAPATNPEARVPGSAAVALEQKACVPRVTPRGIAVFDASGRVLNSRGIHLTDWDGFLANPAVTLTLRPPPDVQFPVTAILSADNQRLYFDLSSTVGASGPSKRVRFQSPDSAVTVRLGIFPDRDAIDEHHRLTLTLYDAQKRVEQVAITVHDYDRDQPLLTRIVVDFSEDRTGFFNDAQARKVVQRAADDWSYFLDDMGLDPVAKADEATWVFDRDGFENGRAVLNARDHAGFLLYAYGFHTSALRSGGEGSYQGKPPTSGAVAWPLRRSGGLEVETQGNYNSLGWIMDLDPDLWWVSANQGREQNDLYSIVHHEMGHAHGFNPAYSRFAAAKQGGLASPALAAYYGGPLAIDAPDHLHGAVDPASGFGAHGNEYHGQMPPRRWLITRLDLLALEAVGYKLRPLSFEVWRPTARRDERNLLRSAGRR
jgi:hypothetical protein